MLRMDRRCRLRAVQTAAAAKIAVTTTRSALLRMQSIGKYCDVDLHTQASIKLEQ